MQAKAELSNTDTCIRFTLIQCPTVHCKFTAVNNSVGPLSDVLNVNEEAFRVVPSVLRLSN